MLAERIAKPGLTMYYMTSTLLVVKLMGQSVPREFAFRIDSDSGVPVYRQLIDQVQVAIATGVLKIGDQLPTVRRVAVDLAINPNTVSRSYREMELRGILDTQQGTGTFVADNPIERTPAEGRRQLTQLVTEFVARAGSAGFTVRDLQHALRQLSPETSSRSPK
jgi:GntR family transcriptional regulator